MALRTQHNLSLFLRIISVQILFFPPSAIQLCSALVKKRWNRVVCFIVKAVWFDVMLYLVWRFVFGMMTNFPVLDAYMPWIMFPVGILLFYPYDYMMFRCQMSVDALVSRIRRR